MTDLGSEQGTYINGQRLAPNAPHRLMPEDELCFGSDDLGGKRYKVSGAGRAAVQRSNSQVHEWGGKQEWWGMSCAYARLV